MQSDADVSRALESHERALFARWEDDQREELEDDGPLWDPCDVDEDPTPDDYYEWDGTGPTTFRFPYNKD